MIKKYLIISLILLSTFITQSLIAESSFYSLKATDINGENVDFKEYKNKVLLITNFSSKCGTTPQLKEFQELYDKFKSQKFIVLAFASEDFAPMDIETDSELKHFCEIKFGVNFEIFKVVNVKGKNIHPVFKFLTESNNELSGSIGFNAEKFLINKEGLLVNRYGPFTGALSSRIQTDIKEVL
ncbi:UNVERIFIED_CONTAM: hypothetical protein GTU68_063622 [Idotea baltica]|nr:hypothetical protein [Idotea baltica]